MTFTCPKCGTEDTTKLSIVIEEAAQGHKGGAMGLRFASNVQIPLLTGCLALFLLFGLAMASGTLGFVAFVVVLYGGYRVRKGVLSKATALVSSKYSGLPAMMLEQGFVCKRCEHTFLPS